MKPRINLFGGPGVGKSTLAAKLFAHLKQEGTNVELVQEVIKQWAYEGRKIQPWDCVSLFGHQFEAEQRLLQNGVQHIITDSPLLLQCIYAQLIHDCPAYWELAIISKMFDKTWPAINLFVCRPTTAYETYGRYETYEAAIKMDEDIENILASHMVQYHCIHPDSVIDFIHCLNLLETQ